MGWWKADSAPAHQQLPLAQNPPTPLPPHHVPVQSTTDSATACPVDPKTREIWLQQAQAMKSQQQSLPHKTPSQSQLPPSHPPIPTPTPQKRPQSLSNLNTTTSSRECSSDRISQSSPTPESLSPYTPSRSLSEDRVISSIPRAFPSFPSSSPSPTTPANAETETGPHRSGNWIYPSESQFFHAVMRKSTLQSTSPEDLASSVSSIIPIHNAVNERAWHLIQGWEKPSTLTTRTKTCSGPKLLSFQGLGEGAKSPKARLMTLWGYTAPFDRHDWIVERCDGSQVEYVIDFYQGKAPAEGVGKQDARNLNFYLDVRPKLNSLDGWKMRAERMVGWR